MPKRARRICTYPGCTQTVRKGRCVVHQAAPKFHGARRLNSTRRGYGYKWQRLRRAYLAAHPLCGDPFNRHPDRVVVATEVDHIIPRAEGGSDRPDNLQGLCKSCHSYKTLTIDMKRRGKGRGV